MAGSGTTQYWRRVVIGSTGSFSARYTDIKYGADYTYDLKNIVIESSGNVNIENSTITNQQKDTSAEIRGTGIGEFEIKGSQIRAKIYITDLIKFELVDNTEVCGIDLSKTREVVFENNTVTGTVLFANPGMTKRRYFQNK
jgi:hypothetical protein